MKKNTFQRILRLIWKYFMFFSLISVTVTCCMSLFLNVFSSNMGITYTAENIDIAAKLTFGNVILLTLLFTVIDNVRRKFTVTKPLNQITEAADKIVQGDFSVRIPEVDGFITDNTFNEIINCSIKWRRNCRALRRCVLILQPMYLTKSKRRLQ